MKKFLVFLVSIIVVICLGMTFYAFAKDEEVIKINTASVYLNAGDTLSLDDIGFVHTNKKSETKINFNAGGDETKSIIKYEEELKKYVTTNVGGTTKIVITTNNKKFKKFEINVEVGNGSMETPFLIRTEEELFAIGTSKFDTTPDNDYNEAMSSYYRVMNDIEITESHDSIGYNAETDTTSPFQGNFDGNYYTIKNLKTNPNTYGGLFAIVGDYATVQNVYFENASLNGAYNYVGTVAGVINGYIDRIGIKNSNIVNLSNLESSFTGGIAGKISTVANNTDDELNSSAKAFRISLENDNDNVISGNGYVGGIAGSIDCADIDGIKIASTIVGGKYVGAFAGMLTVSETAGYIRESYSISDVSSNNSDAEIGALIGAVNATNPIKVNSDTVLLGLYYNSEICNLDPYYSTTFIIDTTTVRGVTETDLKDPDTFTFYYNGANSSVVKWRATIWQITEGQYPLLKYTTYSVPSNIQKPTVDDPADSDQSDSSSDSDNNGADIPNNPDNSGSNIPPITDPDTNPDNDIIIDKTIIEINNVSDFEKMTETGYTYILNKDVFDFENASWTPIKLQNSIVKSASNKTVTIKNVKIVAKTNFVGFFSSIDNSSVSDIKFSNVTFDLDVRKSLSYVGTLAGKVNKSNISNVSVENATISSNLNNVEREELPYYVGGLIGGFTTSETTITNANVQADISGNIRIAGGIVGFTKSNVIITNSTFIGSIQAKEVIGGIAGINEGFIENCQGSSATIKNYEQGITQTYMGGIAGVNHGAISNSTISLYMEITNEKPACNFYVGGITGYNNSNKEVTNCTVSGEGIKVNGGTAYVYIGGIAGENKGYVTKSSNKMTSIGSNKSNIFVGGLVANNLEGAELKYSKVTSDLYGEYVGGLVYNNSDSSLVEECIVSKDGEELKLQIKGNSVASLVHTMTSGYMTNCLAITKTYGLDASSVSASLVISFPSSTLEGKNVYGTISKCIVSNDFTGNGEKWLDTPADVLGKKRITGTITNCVIDSTYSVNCKQAEYDKIFWIKQDAGSNSSYMITDNMTDYDNYANFEMSNETNLVWYYSPNKIPKLSYFLK